MVLMALQIVCVSAVLLHPSYITILAFSLTEGFCIAGIPTLMGILPFLYFSKDIYGKVFGLLTLAFGLVVSVSPLLGGYLDDLTHSLSSPYLLGLTASLISLGMILFLLKQSAFLKS